MHLNPPLISSGFLHFVLPFHRRAAPSSHRRRTADRRRTPCALPPKAMPMPPLPLRTGRTALWLAVAASLLATPAALVTIPTATSCLAKGPLCDSSTYAYVPRSSEPPEACSGSAGACGTTGPAGRAMWGYLQATVASGLQLRVAVNATATGLEAALWGPFSDPTACGAALGAPVATICAGAGPVLRLTPRVGAYYVLRLAILGLEPGAAVSVHLVSDGTTGGSDCSLLQFYPAFQVNPLPPTSPQPQTISGEQPTAVGNRQQWVTDSRGRPTDNRYRRQWASDRPKFLCPAHTQTRRSHWWATHSPSNRAPLHDYCCQSPLAIRMLFGAYVWASAGPVSPLQEFKLVVADANIWSGGTV